MVFNGVICDTPIVCRAMIRGCCSLGGERGVYVRRLNGCGGDH